MTYKNKSVDPFSPQGSKKIKKQAEAFPSVGMTLPTYTPLSPTNTPRSSSIANDDSTHRRRFITKKRVLIFFIIIILAIGGYVGWKVVRNSVKLFGGNILGIVQTTKLQGESTGRVNILLAGNSADDVGHQGADLTDSIMVVSIDTQNNTALLLSIPRDFYVNVPGYGYQKINEAYVDGQNNQFNEAGYAAGGMGLLEKVVQADFGITINYDTLVNYDAFRDAVNAVGGITVNIQSSDPRGLYDPSIDYVTHGPLVKLTNGEHTLDGEQALDLARARGDAPHSYGFPLADFNRTQNQRLMLVALKTKVLTSSVLANPIAVGNLFDAVGNNVTTDFNISQVKRLYQLTKNISNSNITSVSLNSVDGVNLLANYTTDSGQDALIPAAGIGDYTAIQSAITRLFSNNAIVKENANVVVLNATNADGQAAAAETTLESKQVNVTAIADATADAATSSIITTGTSATTMPQTLKLIESLYGTTTTATNPYAAAYPNANFILIVGADHQVTTTSTGNTNE
jgi:LCP family protein required for cell wall assembly